MGENQQGAHHHMIKQATTAPEISAFEQIKHTDENGEYWSARELAKLLGYTLWQNFERVIAEAKVVCATIGGDVAEVFRTVTKTPSRKGGRPGSDYALTRHACYLIAASADGRKPQVAIAMRYFARSADSYDSLTPSEHADHIQAGQLAFYQETQQEVWARKGLAWEENISDHMGSLETSANDFRAALARHLLIDRGVADKQMAYDVHHEAGASVRALLVEKGIYPEQLPTPNKSYQQLLREEETRQRLLREDQTGLWARLLAGQVDALGDPDGEEMAPE